MNKSCHDHGDTYAQNLDRCQFTDEEANQLGLNNAGVQIQAAEGNLKKRHLRFQKTAPQASPSRSSHRAFLLSSREMLVRECARLASVIRRTAAVCFTPSTGADEDDLPYMQLDKVTRAVSREAFGPLYWVT